jgi:hypothetical protein
MDEVIASMAFYDHNRLHSSLGCPSPKAMQGRLGQATSPFYSAQMLLHFQKHYRWTSGNTL